MLVYGIKCSTKLILPINIINNKIKLPLDDILRCYIGTYENILREIMNSIFNLSL